MGVSGHGSLRLCPAHYRRGPGGPASGLGAVGAGIGLVAEVKEAYMSQRLRAEPADFQVVLDNRERLTYFVDTWFEELTLEVVTGSPGQIAADVEAFSLDMEEHIAGEHSFRRVGVMSTPGGMNVMIATVETVAGGVDPALQLHSDL